MKKYKLIAIIGKSGSGKNTVIEKLFKNFRVKNKIHRVVQCTTRPPRVGEVNGIDYHFVTKEYFTEEIISGSIIEATNYTLANGSIVFYGTSIESLSEDKVNIGIFNPYSVDCLVGDPNIDLEIIYIDCYNSLRIIRSMERESNVDVDEVIRRFKMDERDFDDLDFDFTVLYNYNKKSLRKTVSLLIQDILSKSDKSKRSNN